MKYPRSQPCPCGSGEKYKACCAPKGIEYVLKGGEPHRVVPLPREVPDDLRRLKNEFVKKFGREPGPNDPVLFDPSADAPQAIGGETFRRDIVEGLKQMGAPDPVIYAYNKTGMIVTPWNEDGFSKKDLEEYREAIEEFQHLFPDGKFDSDQRARQMRAPEGRPARTPRK